MSTSQRRQAQTDLHDLRLRPRHPQSFKNEGKNRHSLSSSILRMEARKTEDFPPDASKGKPSRLI